MIKKFYNVSCYDIIMKLGEFSKSSKDYIAEMPVKLGLVVSNLFINLSSTLVSRLKITYHG